MSEDHSDFITVTEGMRGYFPVWVTWTKTEYGGFWEPYQSHPCSSDNEDDAAKMAKLWAEDEGVRYVP